MSQTLQLPNFTENNLIYNNQSQLTAAPSPNPGSSALAVDNAVGYTTGYLLLGVAGSSIAELLPNTSVNSGVSIALVSPTVLPHNQFDPVYPLFGNQLKVYRAADGGLGQQPPDSAFTLLSGMPISIDPSSDSTEYTDPSGGGNFWYKYTFFNAGSGSETDLGSAVATRGAFTVNYCSLDEIRREAGFRYARYVTDDQINEMRQAAQNTIDGQLEEFYAIPFQPPIPAKLKRIATVLSAGYLRQAQYSQISDPQVNGQNKVDEASIELDRLSLKETVLVNQQGQSLDGPGASGGVEGWPNASTATTAGAQGGAPRVFRMSDIQGQPYTVDASGNPNGNLYYGRRW